MLRAFVTPANISRIVTEIINIFDPIGCTFIYLLFLIVMMQLALVSCYPGHHYSSYGLKIILVFIGSSRPAQFIICFHHF